MIDMKAEVNGLNEKVVKMLAERKMTVSAAESCTGGLFAALITNVSGASEVLNYETAFDMADGLRKNTGADVTVGITGIAGPTGGTKEKPVGLVYVGICVMGETEVKELHLNGTREEIREGTCKITFENIANRIENITKVQ